MKRARLLSASLAAALILAAVSPLPCGAWTIPDNPLENRLRIGIRVRQTYLHDDTRTPDDSFRGSITRLREQPLESPLAFVTFEWLFNQYVGAQLGWEQVRAETYTTQPTPSLNHSDGDVSVFGPSLMVNLRYPNETRLTPCLGVGYAWLASTFDHNPAWQNGFGGATRDADYAAWVAAGRPAWPNEGVRRTISLDDCTAWLLACGLEIQLAEQVDLCVFAQYMDADGADLTQVMDRYGTTVLEVKHGTFPMSSTTYGAGLRWTF